MEFSEKLTSLFNLMGTKNVTIARALNVDAAQISRLKTGARSIPAKSSLLSEIAEYLAEQCDSEYRLSALYELTTDPRLHTAAGQTVIRDVIADWLTHVEPPRQNDVGRLLDNFGKFSSQTLSDDTPVPTVSEPALDETSFVAYYGNDGRRRAMRDFSAFILSQESPCTVRLFTDEQPDWMLEDMGFSSELSLGVRQMVKKGCRFQRINASSTNVSQTFFRIDMWMPAYMAGAMRQYYYPWNRDELHRRTIFLVPGQIAMFSTSLYGQKDIPMTILTKTPRIVNLMNADLSTILSQCRPTMNLFTADSPDRLFNQLLDFSALRENAVYKSSFLSPHTLPMEIAARIKRQDPPFSIRLYDSLVAREQLRFELLETNTVTEIMCMPPLEDVMAGRMEIPGTYMIRKSRMFYKPEEYRLHLENILMYLEAFPNYHVIWMDNPTFENVVIYTKGTHNAMLVKESDPFSMFDIAEQGLAATLCEYLRRMAEDKLSGDARKKAIDRLNDELQRVDSAIREKDRADRIRKKYEYIE